MREVKLYGVILLALMIVSYLSWHHEDAPKEDEKPVLVDIKPEMLDGIAYFTKTQTVSVSFRKDESGERYPWFEIEARTKKRLFAGNEKFEEEVSKYAPFRALRSLGKGLSPTEIEQTKLDKPDKKLRIDFRGKYKTFLVGGRTSGSRDHYVKKEKDDEVFLIESKLLGDLEYPEGRFMQRKLRNKQLQDVDKVLISAAAKSLTVLHRNRQSTKDAFWALEAAPDEKNETAGNYVEKLDRLTATEYLEDPALFDKATLIMEVTWFDEDGKSLGSFKLARDGEDKKAEYYALGTLTRVPVKVPRYSAEQLEKDLSVLFPR